MLFIIAGTDQQEDDYARSINLKRNEYRLNMIIYVQDVK